MMFLEAKTVGIWQVIVMATVILILFGFPLFVVLYRREEPKHDLPWWSKLLLLGTIFVQIGLIIGLYIFFRKKKFEEEMLYKFNQKTRYFGLILAILTFVASISFVVLSYLQT